MLTALHDIPRLISYSVVWVLGQHCMREPACYRLADGFQAGATLPIAGMLLLSSRPRAAQGIKAL